MNAVNTLTHSILFVSVGTQGFNKKAPLLSVYSPFCGGAPCQTPYVDLLVRLHISFGRPLVFLPSAVQRKAVLGSAPGDIRHTCPSHLHLLLLISMARDVASVLRSSSSFVLVLGLNTNRIFRRRLFLEGSELMR